MSQKRPETRFAAFQVGGNTAKPWKTPTWASMRLLWGRYLLCWAVALRNLGGITLAAAWVKPRFPPSKLKLFEMSVSYSNLQGKRGNSD
jgi:hypothetical protein